MIRDIGQRGHEKRRKSGIVRGRGKAGGVAWPKKNSLLFLFFFPLTPPLALPGLLRSLYIPPKSFKGIPKPPFKISKLEERGALSLGLSTIFMMICIYLLFFESSLHNQIPKDEINPGYYNIIFYEIRLCLYGIFLRYIYYTNFGEDIICMI